VFLSWNVNNGLLQDSVALIHRQNNLIGLGVIEAVCDRSRVYQLVPNAVENVVIARVPSASPTDYCDLMMNISQ
jgi:hypothetical protein